MLFDDLTCSRSEFQRIGTTTEKEFYPWEQTTIENQMNGALWAWVLEKTWKIDTKVLQKKELDRQ
jgi:hypothetical protein